MCVPVWSCHVYLCGDVMEQGDFTRTGERKLAGVMKDGVNSANRYYLNRFRDAYRQAVIGTCVGEPCPFLSLTFKNDLLYRYYGK